MPRYRVTLTYETEVEARDTDEAERFVTEDVEHGQVSGRRRRRGGGTP